MRPIWERELILNTAQMAKKFWGIQIVLLYIYTILPLTPILIALVQDSQYNWVSLLLCFSKELNN